MKRVLLLLSACLALSAVPAFADTNFITNGGFETGDFTGWNTANINPLNTQVAYNGFAGYAPHSGNYFAALADVGTNGILSQTFTDTPGSQLTFSYYLASNGTFPSFFSASINGTVVSSLTNLVPQPYTLYSFNFTGTGNDTISFAERDDPSFLALDDVSVTGASTTPPAVPEPSSLALLGTGLLGTLAEAKRRFARR